MAVLSGAAWVALGMVLFQIQWGWKTATEPSMNGEDWIGASVFILLDVLLLSAIALIPAGGVAVIYRKLRSKN